MKEKIFLTEKDFSKLREQIKKNRGKEIVFSSDDDELNRKILEKEKIDILLLNLKEKRDRQKQRESGFDHVMAKLAKKNGVAIGINFDEIINSHGKNKADILARIRQNVKICNKEKLKMVFLKAKEKNIYDLKSLGLVLGMPTWMTKNL